MKGKEDSSWSEIMHYERINDESINAKTPVHTHPMPPMNHQGSAVARYAPEIIV